MLHFDADAVSSEESTELGVLVVVFAEHGDGSGRRLEIQRSLAVEQTDEDSGMDTYCMCVESGATHYGGVTWWRLHRNYIEIRIDSAAEKGLSIHDGFLVGFNLSDINHEMLRKGLMRLLD